MPIIGTTRFKVQLLLTDEETGHQMTISGSPAKLIGLLTWLAPIGANFHILKPEPDKMGGDDARYIIQKAIRHADT